MSGPTIRPELSELQLSSLKSLAEAKFYRACKSQLGEKYLVLHSITWIQRTLTGEPRDGEADFVIFDPDGGFAVIEIKGGGISHDANKDIWYSIDRHSIQHQIKDPFRQAANEKHAILEQILGHADWGKYINGRVMGGHGVFFTDLGSLKNLILPQSSKEILGCSADLNDIQSWIDRFFAYWKGQAGKYQPLGKPGMAIVNDLFCREIFVKPLLKSELQDEEDIRVKLTEQQARTLRMLGSRRRAAISGGAGTGKTLLALQRARELAAEGKRTLLICYNELLGAWLKANSAGIEHLTSCHYHKLCADRILKVKTITNRDLLAEASMAYPGEDQWDVLRPFALASSTEILDEKFDAVVIDEGQDFKDEFWLSICMLFEKEEEAYFYIFYDDNQSLYQRSADFPIQDPPFVLTVNCRNTEAIHKFSYKFYRGEETDPPGIPGRQIEFIAAGNFESQAIKIHALILDFLINGLISNEQVVVLIDSRKYNSLQKILSLHPLPKPYTWSSGFQGDGKNQILIETIARYKGMESDIVILWGLDNLDKAADREVFYVATSRAKSRLFIVGTEASCNYIKSFD